MTLLAQISDPHIRTGAAGDAPAERLAATVAAVAALDPAPDAVLLSGDVADTPADGEYDCARELLAPLGHLPLHVLAGNHDDHEALARTFGMPAPSYAVTVGEDLRLVVLDTTIDGHPNGSLDEERLAWLDARLAEDPTPTIVAMHHPPLDINITPMDELGIPAADRLALAEVLPRHPHVARVVAGHVHRATIGVVGGVPTFTCPSTSSTLVVNFAANELAFVDDPPAYALHLMVDGSLTTHIVGVS